MYQITTSRFRDHLKSEIDRVIREHRPLRVTRHRGGDFVVLGAEDWSAIKETLYLNQIPGLNESIRFASKESSVKGTRLKNILW